MNSPFVLDCSVAISWCMEDEVSSYAEDVLDRLEVSEAIVPNIWPLEVANVLLVGERRGRLSEAQSVRFAALLENFNIRVDTGSPSRAFGPVLQLARELKLSVYDASYLDLALRLDWPLATLDDKLKRAARLAGVELLDLS